MTIDLEHFTPLASLAGGILIGLAALILMAMNGRVMGISGILGDAFLNNPISGLWRWAFLGGTLVSPFVYLLWAEELLPRPVAAGSTLLIGGFLVGLGSAIGSGCTSGHGICGLARFSLRSFVAVMVFMISAIITVYLMPHGA